LVLFFKKEPLARAKARKRFFLKKEAKTFIPICASGKKFDHQLLLEQSIGPS
jgi:hypothetical protein